MDDGKKNFFDKLRAQVDKLEADDTCQAVVLIGVHPEAVDYAEFTVCHSLPEERMMLDMVNTYSVQRCIQLGYVKEDDIVDINAVVKH